MKKDILLVSFLSLICTACSNNNQVKNDAQKPENTTSAAKENKAANSDDCFKLDINKKYTLNDSDQTNVQILPVTFNNQKAIAVVRQVEGVRHDQIYDLTGRTELGSLDYGIAALGTDPNSVIISTTNQNPLPQYPSNLKPNQKFKLTYNIITDSAMSGEKSESSNTVETEFKGFENLNFLDNENKPLALKNTCHFFTKVEDGTLDEWFAEGYGRVKFIRKMENGDIFMSEAIGTEQ